MADALVVINAGSSSIKFSLYAIDGTALVLHVRGQIEGLTEKAQFVARDAAGIVVGQNAWAASTLDHIGATAYLWHFIERDCVRYRIAAVGHRVVHGGVRFERPVRIDDQVLRELEALIPLAPLHSRIIWHRSARSRGKRLRCRGLRASIRRSTARKSRSHKRSRCRSSSTSAACGVTVSTACRTSSSRASCR